MIEDWRDRRIRELQDENRRLRIVLGQAIHTCGQAIAVPPDLLERGQPQDYLTMINPMTGELIVRPGRSR